MAVVYQQGRPSIERVLSFFLPGAENMPEESGTIEREQLPTCLPISNIDIARRFSDAEEEALDQNRKFEIAYPALADRRGANATPAGRAMSRKVWLNAGRDAAKWLINQLETEQHPEIINGISETITELGSAALSVVLSKLEETPEAKPEYAALLDALSWMTLTLQPVVKSRIEGVIKRYLESSAIDCKIAALHLTRLLDDDAACSWIERAKQSADSELQEEIDDLLDERF